MSRIGGRQSRGPGKTHREVYLPQLGNPAIYMCACVCGCVTYAAVMQQGANADGLLNLLHCTVGCSMKYISQHGQ